MKAAGGAFDFTTIPRTGIVQEIRAGADGIVRVIYRELGGWLVLVAGRPA